MTMSPAGYYCIWSSELIGTDCTGPFYQDRGYACVYLIDPAPYPLCDSSCVTVTPPPETRCYQTIFGGPYTTFLNCNGDCPPPLP